MLDRQREVLVDRIPGAATAQERPQALGEQSAAGWASGLSAPALNERSLRNSAPSQGCDAQDMSQATRSTLASTLVVEDDVTVSSLGDPEGTAAAGDLLDDEEAFIESQGEGFHAMPQNDPGNHVFNKNDPIGDALRLPKPGGWKRARFCMQNPTEFR